MRVAFVVAFQGLGGVGPACRYMAEALARLTPWSVTLTSLHDQAAPAGHENGVAVHRLGLETNTARHFLEWLRTHPQDVVITANVPGIEAAYRFLPQSIVHILQIHDPAGRYRAVALRHAAFVDGVTCVGHFFEPQLREQLARSEFQGLLRTVPNGATFPPLVGRHPDQAVLRLLYVGRMEPQKGVFDFPPLLARLRRQEVPVRLTLVGGHDATLARAFSRYGVADAVTWTGRLPHAECYRPATESDVALLLTRKEAFGMTAIEAMAMGCVPIAYDMRTGCREIIEHQKSGVLVPAGRLDLVASALASLHHDRQRLSALSAGAIDRARTCFASDAVARSLIGFIDEVIERRPRHMPQRDTGEPSRSDDIPFAPRRRGYQRLSSSIRKYAHRILCSHPGLANLVYNQ